MTDFAMPEVKVGDIVYFYPHDGAQPALAFVTDTASRTLTLWAVVPGYGGVEKVSVHHASDPGLAEFPADPRLAILSERVSALEKKLSAIAPKKA
jgi:hypothetical protein